MFAQTIVSASQVTSPTKLSADDAQYQAIDEAASLITTALRLRLSDDVIAMALQCATESPKKLMAALRMARLPNPVTWIEIEINRLEAAYALIRNLPIERHDTGATLGFLCEETPDGILVRQIHIENTLISTSTIRHLMKIGPWWDPTYHRPTPDSLTATEVNAILSTPIKPYINGPVFNDYLLYAHEYASRISIVQTDLERNLIRQGFAVSGPEATAAVVADHKETHSLNINDIVLPVLILLCCKNATHQRPVIHDRKVRKKNARMGLPPLLECQEVVSHLVPKTAWATGNTREARAAMVMGHYKVRETGIFWWSPHTRRGYGKPSFNKLVKP